MKGLYHADKNWGKKGLAYLKTHSWGKYHQDHHCKFRCMVCADGILTFTIKVLLSPGSWLSYIVSKIKWKSEKPLHSIHDFPFEHFPILPEKFSCLLNKCMTALHVMYEFLYHMIKNVLGQLKMTLKQSIKTMQKHGR